MPGCQMSNYLIGFYPNDRKNNSESERALHLRALLTFGRLLTISLSCWRKSEHNQIARSREMELAFSKAPLRVVVPSSAPSRLGFTITLG